jgi:hypothetical protein
MTNEPKTVGCTKYLHHYKEGSAYCDCGAGVRGAPFPDSEPKKVENTLGEVIFNGFVYVPKSALTTAIEAERARIVQGVEGMKKDTLEEARNGIVAAQATAGYNKAISDILALLTPSNLSDKTNEV